MSDEQSPVEGTIRSEAAPVAPEKRILSVADIIGAPDLDEQEVFVPLWGGSVKVRGITKAKQQEIRKAATVAGEMDSDRLEMFLFIAGVYEPQFTAENYEQLRNKNANAVDSVLKVIAGLNATNPGNPTTGERSSVDEAERTFPAR